MPDGGCVPTLWTAARLSNVVEGATVILAVFVIAANVVVIATAFAYGDQGERSSRNRAISGSALRAWASGA
jgi:hypothetical protein